MPFKDQNVDDIIQKLGPYVTVTLLNFLLVIAFVSVVFLIIKSLLKINVVKQQCQKRKYLEPIILFCLGIVTSVASFWYYNYLEWSYLFIVIAFFILGFNLSYWFVLGAVPLIIYNAMTIYGVTTGTIPDLDVYQILAFAILFGQIIIFTFIHSFVKFKSNFIYFSYNLIIFSVLLGVLLPIVLTQPLTRLSVFDSISISVDLLMTILISFLGFGLVKFINRFIYKTEKLGINVSYKNGFIIKKFANEQIKAYINKNDINFAYIIKFSILGIEPFIASYGYSVAHKIKIDMLLEAQKKLTQYNGLFYMQGDDSEYFAMLPITDIQKINLKVTKNGNTSSERTSNDDLKFLERILTDISYDFNKTLQLDFKINLFAHAMIYGITSSNYLEINSTLENMNITRSTYSENVVVLIDTNIVSSKKDNQKNKALEHLNKFGPNDITVNLARKNIEGSNLKLYESDAVLLKDFLLSKQEIYKITKNEFLQSAIICHISAKSIKAFVDQKINQHKHALIVDYPQYLLEQPDFNIYELISNITSYQILPSQIILNILISRQSFTGVFYDNLVNLVETDLKIAFANLVNKEDPKIKKLNPLYL